MRFHFVFGTALLFLLFVCATTLSADEAPMLVQFPTSGGLVIGAGGRFVDGPVETIEGSLYLPSGTRTFPAVVISHGCGGVSAAQTGWAAALRTAGYAVLIVDSFRPRGLEQTCENLFALNAVRRVPDVYGALRWLASDPRFDRQKIALMGHSHGGAVTVMASQSWAKERFGGSESFRAYFPFYPACFGRYVERSTITAPMRIHIGAEDDWTPAAPCEVLVRELKAKNLDARITLYRGAQHGFDNSSAPRSFYNPQGMGFRRCESVGNPLTTSVLGPYDVEGLRRCMEYGVHGGYSPSATQAALRNVLAELQELGM